jgi:hypothetical protein
LTARALGRLPASRIIDGTLVQEALMSLLDIIIILLVIGWAGGLTLHVAGGFIHLLLVIALIVLIFRVVSGRRV